MKIYFANHRLERAGESDDEAVRAWGTIVAARFAQRLHTIEGAETVEEIYRLRSLRFHKLRGRRAGQYAITLTGNWRLVVRLLGEDTILIEEVVDYHGD